MTHNYFPESLKTDFITPRTLAVCRYISQHGQELAVFSNAFSATHPGALAGEAANYSPTV